MAGLCGRLLAGKVSLQLLKQTNISGGERVFSSNSHLFLLYVDGSIKRNFDCIFLGLTWQMEDHRWHDVV